MTDPVIRALSASDAHLFDALPDPLGAREGHRRTRFRPDWKRVALRDGEVVARGAWWGGPDDSEPVNINWFDVAEGEEEAGAELLRSAPWQVELEINLPGDWREKADLRAGAEARFAAARAAGYELLVERFLYRWTPERGLPERPGRLRFSAEPDDAVFFDALRRIHSVTLDAHALRAIGEGGLDQAAQEELDFFHWCPSPRSGGTSRTRRRATWPASTSRPTTPPARPSASSESCRNSAVAATPTTSSRNVPTSSSSRGRSS